MKLIWTYSPKLNRSNKISHDDMLKLFYHSIECGSKFHSTCVYTDTPEKFIGKVDEIIELPSDFEIYFLDDIKFYVMENESSDYTLIDGDLFIDSPIKNVSPNIGTEVYISHRAGIHYEKYNRVLESEGVIDIIPYWKSSLGYYNLGLIQINKFQHKEFIIDYKKLKQFYKDKIEGIYFNRKNECVEISLCTYFFTLFNMYKMNKHTQLSKSSYIHLCGPGEDSKLKFIKMLNSTPSII
jgi:hypothetical protein|tara:strand:- start:559 stop:1275 length:717 start_codon:yes stop_codon:yes gene_type:complete